MKAIIKIYQVTLLFMVLWGAHAWFTWILDEFSFLGYVFMGLFLVVSLIYKQSNNVKIPNSDSFTAAIILFILALLFIIGDIKDIPKDIVLYTPLFILLADEEHNEEHLEFVSKALGWLIILGAVPYILRSYSLINLPSTPIFYYNDVKGGYVFDNYFLFIVNTYLNTESPRFCSIFLEPGYLGTLSAFLLYLNRYNMNKIYNVFILVGVLMSLSLAGYIILLLGYLFHVINDKKKLWLVLLTLLVSYSIFSIAPIINNGENYINTEIVERLAADEEKGIAGNDRFHGQTDALYDDILWSIDFLFGVSKSVLQTKDVSGAGYKIFIIQHGLIPFVLFILFYFKIASLSIDRKRAYYAVILLFFIFLQATTPESYRWLIPFGLYVQSKQIV